MRRYLAGLMDPFVSLLEVHKLLYFMQEAGQPLRLTSIPKPLTDLMQRTFATYCTPLSKAISYLGMPMAVMHLTSSSNWCQALWRMLRPS